MDMKKEMAMKKKSGSKKSATRLIPMKKMASSC